MRVEKTVKERESKVRESRENCERVSKVREKRENCEGERRLKRRYTKVGICA